MAAIFCIISFKILLAQILLRMTKPTNMEKSVFRMSSTNPGLEDKTGETEMCPIKHQINMFQELIIKIQWVEVLGNTNRFQYNY